MFQNASSLKPLGQLKPNCSGMIIGGSSTKFRLFNADRKSNMAVTAGHRLTLDPILTKNYIKINERIWFGPVYSIFPYDDCAGLMEKGTSGNLLEDFCKSMVSANDTLHFVTEYLLWCKGGITEVWLWLEFCYSKIGQYSAPLHTVDVGSKRQSPIQLIFIHAIVITYKVVLMIWPFWGNELNYSYFVLMIWSSWENK